jgi:hypothetical protein
MYLSLSVVFNREMQEAEINECTLRESIQQKHWTVEETKCT